MYAGKQEQTACPFTSLHWLWGPQGLGMQGLSGAAWVEAEINKSLNLNGFWMINEHKIIHYLLSIGTG